MSPGAAAWTALWFMFGFGVLVLVTTGHGEPMLAAGLLICLGGVLKVGDAVAEWRRAR